MSGVVGWVDCEEDIGCYSKRADGSTDDTGVVTAGVQGCAAAIGTPSSDGDVV